ncbi:hypothetical protein [Marinilactibacillus sp. Marseille-P9653]|uniref:hypothetical protein n=1 Tax=Marinilactibacillus sp. Marseille-P9653 TaxID=2866583 RepID=UPI001CE3F632|nr:hypothetical protein [Marinilactibacillus sp. Marseille-P9653]
MSETKIYLDIRVKNTLIDKKHDKKTGQMIDNNHKRVMVENGIDNLDQYNNIVIERVNEYNPKLNITGIEYVETPVAVIGRNAVYSGLIERIDDDGVKSSLAYIFISYPEVGSRNAFGSQHLFPGLSKLVDFYIDSPSYDLANLPIYFVNGSFDNITNSMLETVISMKLMGINYIQLHNSNSVTVDLDYYDLKKYSRFISNDRSLTNDTNIIKTDFYNIDINLKKIQFITNSFSCNLETFGSKDRFFVIKSYPALILADELGYVIDVTAISSFVETHNRGRNNFIPFIKYAEKLIEKEQ